MRIEYDTHEKPILVDEDGEPVRDQENMARELLARILKELKDEGVYGAIPIIRALKTNTYSLESLREARRLAETNYHKALEVNDLADILVRGLRR